MELSIVQIHQFNYRFVTVPRRLMGFEWESNEMNGRKVVPSLVTRGEGVKLIDFLIAIMSVRSSPRSPEEAQKKSD